MIITPRESRTGCVKVLFPEMCICPSLILPTGVSGTLKQKAFWPVCGVSLQGNSYFIFYESTLYFP